MNIGAGRVMYQDIVRINLDVQSKKIFDNEQFVDACNRAKSTSSGRLHLLGLIRWVVNSADLLVQFFGLAQTILIFFSLSLSPIQAMAVCTPTSSTCSVCWKAPKSTT